jgi:hypothetical protein
VSLARVDRVASAASRLPGYLRKTRWLELLGAIAAEVQEVEDMWLAMLASNAIDDAGGDQLDQIGKLVDLPRGGSTDEDYRRRIRAKVAVNRSLGLVNDIIRIVRLVVNDAGVAVEIDQQGIAAYVAKLGALAVPTATATDLAAFLRKGTSAGVRSIVESSTVADTDAFILDGPAGLGFVDVPTIDLAAFGLPSGFDTVIGIRPEWLTSAAASIVFGGAPPGPLTLRITFGVESYSDTPPSLHFEADAGTAIEDFENTLASSLYVFVIEPSTISGNFTAGDVIPATGFTGGNAGGALAIAQE